VVPVDQEQRIEVGRQIAALRAERGWSQARLAREAGVSENTVMSIEAGKRQTQGAKLRAVQDALGVTPTGGLVSLVEDVPDDVVVFVDVFIKRMKVLDEPARARILADLYPRLLTLVGFGQS
jgi:transcriptional regulator with XRE-family HTH domain